MIGELNLLIIVARMIDDLARAFVDAKRSDKQ